MQQILEDFPWLWAIHSYWSYHQSDKVKISQNTQDLRLALSQKSTATLYSVWALTVDSSALLNAHIEEMPRNEDATWAEVITGKIFDHLTIKYLFLVGSPESTYAASDIIIFRSPDKTGLDEVVSAVTYLQGSGLKRPLGEDMI